MLDPFLSVVGRKQHTPTHSDSPGSKSDGLENVSAATNAAINIDLHAVKDLGAALMKLQQRDNRRRTGVEIAPAVVAQQDAVDTGLHRANGVVGTHDALEADGQVRVLTGPGDVVPGQPRIDMAGHQASQTAALLVLFGLCLRHGDLKGFVARIDLGPFVRLSLAWPSGIYRDVYGFDLRQGGDQAEQLGGFLPVRADIELEEKVVLRCSLNKLLDRVRGVVGHLERVS